MTSAVGCRPWSMSPLPNITFDRTAGSPSLAAAGQRERSADNDGGVRAVGGPGRGTRPLTLQQDLHGEQGDASARDEDQ